MTFLDRGPGVQLLRQGLPLILPPLATEGQSSRELPLEIYR
jgi:hypothetical protein